ncbi:MAG: hypothetical protein FWD44_07900 [Oscillospiraceae bacterium]|nr:hypothetical protein [Oscillospiraceae bacterium]
MKLFCKFLSLALIMLLLIGCSASPADPTGDPPKETPDNGSQGIATPSGNTGDDIPNFTDIPREEWSATYHRISWSDRGNDIIKICSAHEMQEFGISTIVSEFYDDSFFSDNFLVVIITGEPSGSIRHKMTSITKKDTTFQINIDRHHPEMQTADMASWVIALELNNIFADYEFDVVWEDVPFDVERLSAPAEDLLHVEFYGSRHDDGTYEDVTAVMFVFDGIHDMFNIGAIDNRGRLLSFEDMTLVEHEYGLLGKDINRIRLDGKTGFLLFFYEPFYEAYGRGTYMISFDYLGVLVEAEPVTVVGRIRSR